MIAVQLSIWPGRVPERIVHSDDTPVDAPHRIPVAHPSGRDLTIDESDQIKCCVAMDYPFRSPQ